MKNIMKQSLVRVFLSISVCVLVICSPSLASEPMGRAMGGMFSRMAAPVFNQAMAQFTPQRNFRSILPYCLSSMQRPADAEQGREKVKQMVEQLKLHGYLKAQENALKLFMQGEFAWNGRNVTVQDPPTDEVWKHDAKEPVDIAVYEAMVIKLQELLRKVEPGVAISLGTIAIQSGEPNAAGKIKGENRFVMVTSGLQSEVLEIAKKHMATNDGWDLEKFDVQPGKGSNIITVKDGDKRPAVFEVAICLDYIKTLEGQPGADPVKVDCILSPSAGWPGNGLPPKAKVLVNDSANTPFYKDAAIVDAVEKPYVGLYQAVKAPLSEFESICDFLLPQCVKDMLPRNSAERPDLIQFFGEKPMSLGGIAEIMECPEIQLSEHIQEVPFSDKAPVEPLLQEGHKIGERAPRDFVRERNHFDVEFNRYGKDHQVKIKEDIKRKMHLSSLVEQAEIQRGIVNPEAIEKSRHGMENLSRFESDQKEREGLERERREKEYHERQERERRERDHHKSHGKQGSFFK